MHSPRTAPASSPSAISQAAGAPLVAVFGVEGRVGLTIARALGREGVRCFGVSLDGITYGCRSRHLVGFAALKAAGPADGVSRAVALFQRVRPDFVMAASEPVMQELNRRRDDIDATLLFPEHDVLEGAFDKSRTLVVARALGIPVPRAWDAQALLEGAAPADLAFPVVLKPPRPYTDPPWQRLGFRYRYAHSLAEVRRLLEPFRGAPYLPLVQAYCPGRGVGVELCMHEGEPVAAFQHERIREIPLTGGVSVMRRSAPLHPGMLRDAVRLLRALRWRGVAMVEYRHEPGTDRYWCVEVNGRFWGSLCLPVRCGVNFPYLLLQTMGMGCTPRMPATYPAGVYCRWLSADLGWLWTALLTRRQDLPEHLRGPKIALVARFLRDFVRLPYHDIEWPDDPLPALHFWKDRLRRGGFAAP
jgi:predicted ATP-grasp superfamily ATP-dependent carboligase